MQMFWVDSTVEDAFFSHFVWAIKKARAMENFSGMWGLLLPYKWLRCP